MEHNFIYRAELFQYKPLIWRGQPIYKYYAKLKNYLKQHTTAEFATLFSEPFISEDGLTGWGEWRSAIFSGNTPVPLAGLTGEELLSARELLEHRLGQLLYHSQNLLESENTEDISWGQLIKKSLRVPSEENIFIHDGQIILTLWGFEQNAGDTDYSLTGASMTIPFSAPPSPAAQFPLLAHNVENIQTPDEEDSWITSIPYTDVTETPAPQELPAGKEDDNSLPPPVLDSTGGAQLPPTDNVIARVKTPWWRRWWWLLLILLLLIILLFLKSCLKHQTALPPVSGIIAPVDTTKIISDPDKIKKIVGDRLNIVITGQNKNISQFADDFKKAYPNEDYKIIYYDTTTYRLQIQVPAAQLQQVEKDLSAKMPAFKMLIWYEGLFKHTSVPNDPALQDVEKSWYLKEIGAFAAWEVTRGDPNLTIAIVDDGFDLTHPEFKGKIKNPWNVVTHSARVGIGHHLFHGTHVAGIALGLAGNGIGGAGVAPGCKFMPVQVGDENGVITSTAIIDGILYAVNHGASVINLSLGMEITEEVSKLKPEVQQKIIETRFKDEEKFWEKLYDIAYKKNIIVVLAAGNQNILIGLDPMERSGYTIKVSAVAPNESKAPFSNYGSGSSISAPGVHIYSTVPGNKYAYLDGTSMAAPIVSGGIALIKSVNPAFSYHQVLELLQSTGKPVHSACYIGNIIQLAKAVGASEKSRSGAPKVSCPEIQRQIDSLLQEIEKRRRLCPIKHDTLHIPPKTKDFKFAEGKWRSTSDLYNKKTRVRITATFDFFRDGKGYITLTERTGKTCTSPVSLQLKAGQFNIDQTDWASCIPSPDKYKPYYFTCKADTNNCAVCSAINKIDNTNKINFKLVRVNR